MEREDDDIDTDNSADSAVAPSADPGEPVMQAIGESDPGPPDMQAIAGSGAGYEADTGFVLDEGDEDPS